MVLPASSLHMEKRCKGMQRRGTQCQQKQPPPPALTSQHHLLRELTHLLPTSPLFRFCPHCSEAWTPTAAASMP